MRLKCQDCGFEFETEKRGTVCCIHCGCIVTVNLIGLEGKMDRMEQIKNQIAVLNNEKAKLEMEIRISLEGASYGYANGYRVKYSSYSTRRFDAKKFKEENEGMYDKYIKVIDQDRLTITREG